ncbi:MAG: beta-lactamase family protein [Saccharothrix sp.]|nr:beta-lactamase family protein [Saccharothrix sp.]
MSNTTVNQDRPELDKAIQEIVDAGLTGVQLRVNDEQGEWVGSAGLAELGGSASPPVDGYVRIGSNTKTFTAVVVLGLVAEGRIDLDASAAGYLTGLALDPRITVRMLLQHTSGVFNFTGEYYEDGTVAHGSVIPYGATGREWLDLRFHTYAPRELAELALAKPARFEPGEGWSYSNTNYVLARLLVEQVTGSSLGEEMRRLVFEPLGMTDTIVPDASPEIPEPHAHAYYRYEEDGEQRTVDITRLNPSWISTGGDMISTTRDLHTFISGLLRGRLLSAPLLTDMCTGRPTVIPNMDYGLGVFVVTTDNGTLISHNGGATGHAALLYSTPDGTKTLTGALNYVDDAAMALAGAFQEATQKLIKDVFGRQA